VKTLVYVAIGGTLLALAMVLTGPHIKAHGTAWRAAHRTISAPVSERWHGQGLRPSRNWAALI
jgi:hypothetical protein